jgi:hypothetical protein
MPTETALRTKPPTEVTQSHFKTGPTRPGAAANRAYSSAPHTRPEINERSRPNSAVATTSWPGSAVRGPKNRRSMPVKAAQWDPTTRPTRQANVRMARATKSWERRSLFVFMPAARGNDPVNTTPTAQRPNPYRSDRAAQITSVVRAASAASGQGERSRADATTEPTAMPLAAQSRTVLFLSVRLTKNVRVECSEHTRSLGRKP